MSFCIAFYCNAQVAFFFFLLCALDGWEMKGLIRNDEFLIPAACLICCPMPKQLECCNKMQPKENEKKN